MKDVKVGDWVGVTSGDEIIRGLVIHEFDIPGHSERHYVVGLVPRIDEIYDVRPASQLREPPPEAPRKRYIEFDVDLVVHSARVATYAATEEEARAKIEARDLAFCIAEDDEGISFDVSNIRPVAE